MEVGILPRIFIGLEGCWVGFLDGGFFSWLKGRLNAKAGRSLECIPALSVSTFRRVE